MSLRGRAQVQRGGNSPKFVLEESEVPRPSDREVLVKNKYVAQNPTDGRFLPDNVNIPTET